VAKVRGTAVRTRSMAARAIPPPLRGRSVVDLGRGFGWFRHWAREQGGSGPAASTCRRTCRRAREMTEDAAIEYRRADLETLDLSADGPQPSRAAPDPAVPGRVLPGIPTSTNGRFFPFPAEKRADGYRPISANLAAATKVRCGSTAAVRAGRPAMSPRSPASSGSIDDPPYSTHQSNTLGVPPALPGRQ
jgi:hypothetical protein